jgi:hypothetical protein
MLAIILKPTKLFNTFRFFNEFSGLFDNTTNKLQEAYYKQTFKATSKRNHYFELSFNVSPFETYDFLNLGYLDVIWKYQET